MRDFDGLRKLKSRFKPNRIPFEHWYLLLKECFPAPDYALALAMGVYPSQFSQWKRGLRNPGRTAVQTILLLCTIRSGQADSLYDLVRLHQSATTGNFEKRVRSYLEYEREVLARRAARKAAKEAATSTKSSTTPGETA